MRLHANKHAVTVDNTSGLVSGFIVRTAAADTAYKLMCLGRLQVEVLRITFKT